VLEGGEITALHKGGDSKVHSGGEFEVNKGGLDKSIYERILRKRASEKQQGGIK